jgi:hypothetical protein
MKLLPTIFVTLLLWAKPNSAFGCKKGLSYSVASTIEIKGSKLGTSKSKESPENLKFSKATALTPKKESSITVSKKALALTLLLTVFWIVIACTLFYLFRLGQKSLVKQELVKNVEKAKQSLNIVTPGNLEHSKNTYFSLIDRKITEGLESFQPIPCKAVIALSTYLRKIQKYLETSNIALNEIIVACEHSVEWEEAKRSCCEEYGILYDSASQEKVEEGTRPAQEDNYQTSTASSKEGLQAAKQAYKTRIATVEEDYQKQQVDTTAGLQQTKAECEAALRLGIEENLTARYQSRELVLDTVLTIRKGVAMIERQNLDALEKAYAMKPVEVRLAAIDHVMQAEKNLKEQFEEMFLEVNDKHDAANASIEELFIMVNSVNHLLSLLNASTCDPLIAESLSTDPVYEFIHEEYTHLTLMVQREEMRAKLGHPSPEQKEQYYEKLTEFINKEKEQKPQYLEAGYHVKAFQKFVKAKHSMCEGFCKKCEQLLEVLENEESETQCIAANLSRLNSVINTHLSETKTYVECLIEAKNSFLEVTEYLVADATFDSENTSDTHEHVSLE